MVGKGRGGGGVVGLIKGTTSLFQFFVVVVCLIYLTHQTYKRSKVDVESECVK